jgi:uncharacterized RDD family membrane protein YckC
MDTNVVGRRVGAFLTDSIGLGIINVALLFAMGNQGGGSASVQGGTAVVYFLIVWAIAAGYLGVIQGRTGMTLGKRMWGVRVVGPDGTAPPGPGRGLARWALLIADGFPYIFPCAVGFVVAVSNQQHQRVGDLVAGTFVVRAGSAPQPAADPAAVSGGLPS